MMIGPRSAEVLEDVVGLVPEAPEALEDVVVPGWETRPARRPPAGGVGRRLRGPP